MKDKLQAAADKKPRFFGKLTVKKVCNSALKQKKQSKCKKGSGKKRVKITDAIERGITSLFFKIFPGDDSKKNKTDINCDAGYQLAKSRSKFLFGSGSGKWISLYPLHVVDNTITFQF